MGLVTAHDRSAWLHVLESVEQYDFYHLPDYHILAEHRGEGKGMLFVHREEDAIAAWPFLLRDVQEVEGLEDVGQGYKDATSVYGYPGPLYSRRAGEIEGFISRFHESLVSTALEMRIVSMFSRMNPLLGNTVQLDHFGYLERRGSTVYIDLMQSDDLQFSQFRADHRRKIRRARQQGFNVYRDEALVHLEDFAGMYAETMTRVNAKKSYLFDISYFKELRAALGDRLQMFVVEHEGKICTFSMFVRTGAIVQNHLSASTGDIESALGSRLVIDEARLWAKKAGATMMHLGGGFGGKEDGVFEFKSGFSKCRADFYLWKMVLLPSVYGRLTLARQGYFSTGADGRLDESFFPSYRSSPLSGL
jgi:hypothetical protein